MRTGRASSSSTEDEDLRRFYEDRVVPVAERLAARGVRFIPMGPDPDEDTWYEDAPTEPPELMPLGDQVECLLRLKDLWQRQGLPELAELVEPLVRLAEQLQPPEEQPAEISQYVYVMY